MGFFVANPHFWVKLPRMPRTRMPARAISRHSTGPTTLTQSKGWLVIALALASLGALAAPAEAAWGVPSPLPKVHAAPPDQTWLKDVPEKSQARGKVAVFVFKGDDFFEPLRAAVVRTLRKQQLNVTAALRPADSPAQYREMSYASKLAVFIDGEVSGQGARQTVTIRLRSGVTGQYFASAKFSGSTPALVGSIGGSLWARVGSAIIHACSSATKPRRRESEPTYIEAGSPLDAPLGS
jgi:hypothetical protein